VLPFPSAAKSGPAAQRGQPQAAHQKEVVARVPALTETLATVSSGHLETAETGALPMAKANTVLIKLVSSADTGYFYVSKKNPRAKTEKIELKKYDPIARKHVVFKEQKIK
jgi:large subunit ribosomal protein L33